MRRYRILADFLTHIRLLIGPFLIAVARLLGRLSLPYLVTGQLISWTSDILDGPLARRAPNYPPGPVGRNEVAVDFFEAACLLLALVLAGLAEPTLALWYAVLCAILVLLTRFSRPVVMALQAPVFAWLIIASFLSTTPIWGWLIVAWVALGIALTWPRFPRQIFPDWIAGIASLSTRSRDAWADVWDRFLHRLSHR